MYPFVMYKRNTVYKKKKKKKGIAIKYEMGIMFILF